MKTQHLVTWSLSHLVISVFLLTVPVGAAVELALPEEATVEGPQITLADLVSDLPDADLGAVEIGLAPLPGRTRSISRAQVARQLDRAGWPEERIALRGAPEVRVRRRAHTLTPDRLKAALERELQTPVEFVRRPADLSLPAGEVDLHVVTPPPQPLPPRAVVTVRVRVAGRDHTTLTLPLRFPAAAGRTTNNGQRTTDNGQRTTDNGQRTTDDHSDPLIRRGDRVTLLARAGRVRVSVPGKALSSGRLGDWIRVQWGEDRTVLEGQARATGLVEVPLE